MIEVLAVLTMMASVAAFLLGIVVMAYPLKQLRLSRRWHGLALSGGAFMVFMIAGFGLSPVDDAAHSRASPAPAPLPAASPVRLADVDPSIRSVERTQDRLVIVLFIDSAWSAADYVTGTAITLDEIIEAIQGGATEAVGATNVRMLVMAPGSDRLGKTVEMTLFNVTFDAEDLRQANTENLSFARTLNLATAVGQSPEGARAISAWCGKGSNMSSATSFCLMGTD